MMVDGDQQVLVELAMDSLTVCISERRRACMRASLTRCQGVSMLTRDGASLITDALVNTAGRLLEVCLGPLVPVVGACVGLTAGVQPWDLHVGSRLCLLGAVVTLHRADRATTKWIDRWAAALRYGGGDERALYGVAECGPHRALDEALSGEVAAFERMPARSTPLVPPPAVRVA
jgi:hypothetical protein